ncbi:hypothetical protein ABID22_000133 [Pontibacter aydingkolensis]|uniref:Phage tail tube protein n=1 Tax=Pontibacter aydingkolensis TaxID=1911536 RepID=A0ABS7CQU9_9BACT|nr:hypothetical protein [Pontibacter aydingkolensis]MBW7466199.1 hypothetical protein [Pontibacter aydingkolensis]
MLINGLEYSWSKITFIVAGIPVTRISAINYSDKQEKTNNRGAGSMPVSRSQGAYEATASITLHASEIEALTAAAPNRRLQDIPPFSIIVSYAKPDNSGTATHKLRNVEFMTNGRDIKTGDTLIETELELIVSHIDW